MIRQTIAACATPMGRGALAVVRLSGPDVSDIRDRVLQCRHAGPWRSGRTRRVDLVDAAGSFDDGVAIFAVGPRTYTGEDSLEVTLHGNPLLVERFLAACIAAGARMAGPGEFTRRAAIHGKLDLLAAEGVDQLIRATTPEGVQLARGAVRGTLSAELNEVRSVVVNAIAELEARLDYPGDELALETDAALISGLESVQVRCQGWADSYQTGKRLVDGARVALVGPVNAGKSSLFNALLGQKRALVHDRAGTTRDVVEARARFGRVEVTLLDTAGERVTEDPIEAAGLALAAELVACADLLVIVRRPDGDPAEDAILERTADRARVVVTNQLDRPGAVAHPDSLGISAQTGTGIAELRRHIENALVDAEPGAALVASLRQADLLERVASAIEEAVMALPHMGVAVAAELLTDAVLAMDALTGADTREDVLDALFSRFCIGK